MCYLYREALRTGFTLNYNPLHSAYQLLLFLGILTFCFPYCTFVFFSVVFLENEIMYGQLFNVSDEVLSPEFVLPIGKAKVEREGLCFILLTYMRE